MRNRVLLFFGLGMIAAGIIGMSLQATSGQGWGMHGPMMGGWGASDGQSEPPVPDAPEVRIEATEFSFRPDRPTVEADQAFNLTLANRGAALHDIVVPDIGLHLVVRAGDTVSSGARIREPGEYAFWCTVPGHAERGMTGILVVAPEA